MLVPIAAKVGAYITAPAWCYAFPTKLSASPHLFPIMTQVDSSLPDKRAGGAILYVEDEPVGMTLVQAAVSRLDGVLFFTASGGRDGVRLSLELKPDLVLLDMTLPDISGLEVVRMLSSEISRRTISVILVTAQEFSVEVVKAMSLGAMEYWMKPLSVERLLHDIPRALHRAQAHALTRRPD